MKKNVNVLWNSILNKMESNCYTIELTFNLDNNKGKDSYGVICYYYICE